MQCAEANAKVSVLQQQLAEKSAALTEQSVATAGLNAAESDSLAQELSQKNDMIESLRCRTAPELFSLQRTSFRAGNHRVCFMWLLSENVRDAHTRLPQ